MLNTLWEHSNLIFPTTRQDRHYFYPHFTARETEAYKGAWVHQKI